MARACLSYTEQYLWYSLYAGEELATNDGNCKLTETITKGKGATQGPQEKFASIHPSIHSSPTIHIHGNHGLPSRTLYFFRFQYANNCYVIIFFR